MKKVSIRKDLDTNPWNDLRGKGTESGMVERIGRVSELGGDDKRPGVLFVIQLPGQRHIVGKMSLEEFEKANDAFSEGA